VEKPPFEPPSHEAYEGLFSLVFVFFVLRGWRAIGSALAAVLIHPRHGYHSLSGRSEAGALGATGPGAREFRWRASRPSQDSGSGGAGGEKRGRPAGFHALRPAPPAGCWSRQSPPVVDDDRAEAAGIRGRRP